LNVVIFTMGPSVQKKTAGAAPEGAAPAVMNLEIVVGRLRSASLAASWRNEDDDASSD
jgi:hypothetical protein